MTPAQSATLGTARRAFAWAARPPPLDATHGEQEDGGGRDGGGAPRSPSPHGGVVAAASSASRLRVLDVRGHRALPADAGAGAGLLASLGRLEVLDASGSSLTGVAFARQLPRLRSLVLEGCAKLGEGYLATQVGGWEESCVWCLVVGRRSLGGHEARATRRLAGRRQQTIEQTIWTCGPPL